MIQDLGVGTSSSLGWGLVTLALASAGCSHDTEEPRTPATHAHASDEAVPATDPDHEVIAVDVAPEPPPPPATSRPRLSRTITLGETQYEPLPDAPPPGPGGGGTTVVVNNYVMTPPPYAAYYGGYSYGG